MKEKILNEIFNEEMEGKIILPNFQRDFVWEIKQQKDLLATFLVELPISSILLLKGMSHDFSSRKLCYTEEAEEVKEECFYLLDGQQRMSTLKSVFSDLFIENFEQNYNKLYSKIRNLWFLKMESSDEEDEDIFGYKNLNYGSGNLRKYTPNEILDFIEIVKLRKTVIDWYHPNFQFKKGDKILSGKSRMNAFAEKCAQEKIVPLWGLTKNKLIQEQVLEKIATRKASEIIAEIKDIECEEDRVNKINYYFEDIVHDKIEKENEYNIDELKHKLINKWSSKISEFLEKLVEQKISLIEIEKNEISRGIAIFETINKGGTPLDNFDLIVAKAAKDNSLESLTQRLKNKIETLIKIPKELKKDFEWSGVTFGMLTSSEEINKKVKNQYLNILSILAHVDRNIDMLKIEHIKREKIFQMTSEQINELSDIAITSLLRAILFFNIKLGITKINDISYELMLLPIAYIFSKDEYWENPEVYKKLEYWYWISIFSGRFREKQNIRCVEDIKMLTSWIIKDQEVELLKERKEKIFQIDEYCDFETIIDSSQTPLAIHRSILQFVLSRKPYDLLPNKEERLESVKSSLELEEHHVIPLGNSTKLGELSNKVRTDKKNILNSVLNKVLISKESNRMIGNKTFEKYMTEIKESSRISQFISGNIQQNKNERSEDYYERLLKDRYKRITEEVIKHLNKLLEV